MRGFNNDHISHLLDRMLRQQNTYYYMSGVARMNLPWKTNYSSEN